jgi:quinoprotein glucose dehydrogenase
MPKIFTGCLFLGLISLPLLFSESPPQDSGPYSPKIAPASEEWKQAIRRIRVPEGLKVELFAAEPMLANPVCFCVDEKNRFYVAETFRYTAGVTDSRDHMDWLDDDLACRTVEDRLALLHKHLADKFNTFEIEHDRIRLIEDTDGDGRADRATVFADGFHRAVEGIGAGLLARRGKVWYTCIPNVWLLRDTKGDGKADVRKSLHYGYGVHGGFIGHDLHGLRMGPDGKIYFSSGDRGLNVKTEGRLVASPDAGAVLRCNPDGSELELVATGLRNPQELAFDQYGNLFTGDNNADHGDKARLVYIVEGGDSGWRIGYQFMEYPVDLGPWNAEKLWHTRWDVQAAYIVPPVDHIADGPAGFTYFPGTGQLPERYREHFFLVDFRGASGQSGIRSFAVKPKGASFEMVDQHQFIWSVLATDTDFGMDGALYLTDWVEGWEKTGKGRIYKVYDPAKAKNPVCMSVKKLMAEGFTQRSSAELKTLLDHPDMRVRLEAQFALAERGAEAIPVFAGVLGEPAAQARRPHDDRSNQLARLHALWGLGQIGCKKPEALKPVLATLDDPDTEVRAQAAKLLGDDRAAGALEKLLPLLKDANSRVRFFAAMSVGKLAQASKMTENKEKQGPVSAYAARAIVDFLRANADQDPYLRHAGVMALTWINDPEVLREAARDSSAAVRLAALLVWRRLESPEVAQFLDDPDPRLVLESARAIYDVPIPSALPKLAVLIDRTGLSEPLLYRVLNANFRLGKAENAAAVAKAVGRAEIPEGLRIEALRELGEWAKPSGRDRVVGLWRPLQPRPSSLAADAVRATLGGILNGPDKVRLEAARVAAKLGIKEIGPALVDLLADKNRSVTVRIEALRALQTLDDPRLSQAMELALKDEDAKLRTQGRRVLAKVQPAQAVAELEKVLEGGTVSERQGALAILGEIQQPAADQVLSRWLDRLFARQVPLELQLDLLLAAARHPTKDTKSKLAKYEAARPKNDPLANYQEALAGGDAEAGRKIFLYKGEVACLRCHKVKGEGGEVGPDLTGIGSRQKREYLLEAIVDPNKQIAQGYETVVVTMTNGQVHTGIIKAEDAKEVRLMTPEGQLLTLAKSKIEERNRGPSAMPADIIKHLTKSELRDLVEFLAGLK